MYVYVIMAVLHIFVFVCAYPHKLMLLICNLQYRHRAGCLCKYNIYKKKKSMFLTLVGKT